MFPTVPSFRIWRALAVLGCASIVSAQTLSPSKAPSLPPVSLDEIVPMHLQHQKQEVLQYQSVRLQVPRTPEAPFTLRVPWDGVEHDLDLRLFDVRASDYRLVEARDGGELVELAPGPIHTFRGTVRDDKDASVAGATLISGMQAVVLLADGRQIEIQPDYEAFARGDREAFIVFDTLNTVPCCENTCGVDDRYKIGSNNPPPPPGWTPACAGDLCLAEIALDIDFVFYQTFGSSSSLASDIGAHTINVANLQYERELHIRHRITFTVVRTSAGSEPAGYGSSANTNDLLTAFQNHWNSSMGGVTRDLAHILTGRHGGAGLAYVGITCNDPGNSYGLSSIAFNLFGGTTGIGCYSNVVAHELGHNWGANHCACSSPPFTMNPSYRPCPLRFGSISVGEIDAHRDANSGCLGDSVYNDDAAYAMEVNSGVTFFDSNVGSSTDGSSTCGFGGNLGFNDVWYFYRPAASGTLSVNTCGAGTNFDTMLSIHTGVPGTGANEVGCNDDFCGGTGLASSTSAPVTGGQTYWIRVSGYAGSTGSFELAVSGPAIRAPINETQALAMDSGPGNYYGTTAGATDDGNSSCAGASSADVWFRYTPYSGEIVTLSTFGSLYDTVLTVFNAAGTTELFCNDDAPSPFFTLQSFIEFAPTPATTYLIRLGGFGTAAGPYVLHISGPDSYNSLCSNALSIGEGTRIGSFQGLFEGDGASTCPNDQEPDLYYSFVAPAGGTLTVTTCGTHDMDGTDAGPDTVVSLHSACPTTAGNQLACNDDAFPACGGDTSFIRDSILSASVSSGQNVRIRVSRYSPTQGRKPFRLTVDHTPAPPANDNCASATPIGNGTFAGTLVNATNDGTTTCGAAGSSPDVWYRYTATCTGLLNVTTCGTHDTGGADVGMDTVVSVHSACGAASSDCNDDSYLCGTLDVNTRRDSNLQVPVVTGQQVLIRVAPFSTSLGGPFTLRTSCGTYVATCIGDGVFGICPCANEAPLGTLGGCLNSLTLSSRIIATGLSDISADTVLLQGSLMGATAVCTYFQGTAESFALFGDGIRCIGGTVVRLKTVTNSGGASQYPQVGDPSVSVRGMVFAPGSRYYGGWYRNAAAFCTAATFNLTNGIRIYWHP